MTFHTNHQKKHPMKHNHKTLKHYNTPGHAHGLTFTCYHRADYLKDPVACRMLMEEIGLARKEFSFYLWAYVLMPNHVHLLLWPYGEPYDISLIQKKIKGNVSRKYGIHLKKENPVLHEKRLVKLRKVETFLFWQRGGGFDRNIWKPEAIHSVIDYIEANPVKAGLASDPSEWKWSSAYGRKYDNGLMPDEFQMPVVLK